jgi:hypothetical protein
MGTFKAKEGLFEYSIKRLRADQRHEALRRVERSVPVTDESLRSFLNIGSGDHTAGAHAESMPLSLSAKP